MSKMALKIAGTLCLFARPPTMPANQAPAVLTTRAETSRDGPWPPQIVNIPGSGGRPAL